MTEASGPAAGVWGSHTELGFPHLWLWAGTGGSGMGILEQGVLESTSIADR